MHWPERLKSPVTERLKSREVAVLFRTISHYLNNKT
jgi:hypothetical protein